jgi:hypothetical protein
VCVAIVGLLSENLVIFVCSSCAIRSERFVDYSTIYSYSSVPDEQSMIRSVLNDLHHVEFIVIRITICITQVASIHSCPTHINLLLVSTCHESINHDPVRAHSLMSHLYRVISLSRSLHVTLLCRSRLLGIFCLDLLFR